MSNLYCSKKCPTHERLVVETQKEAEAIAKERYWSDENELEDGRRREYEVILEEVAKELLPPDIPGQAKLFGGDGKSTTHD